MGCENCIEAQKRGWKKNQAYYFRWKTANIALMGCEEHIKEVMEWLRQYYNKAGGNNSNRTKVSKKV